MIEKGTLRYEIERIRLYITRVLLEQVRGKEISPEQLKAIAKDTLEMTDKIADKSQIDATLNELVKKYPILEPALVNQLSYEEDQLRAAAASKVTELLKQGKIEEAGMLAHKYNEQKV